MPPEAAGNAGIVRNCREHANKPRARGTESPARRPSSRPVPGPSWPETEPSGRTPEEIGERPERQAADVPRTFPTGEFPRLRATDIMPLHASPR